MLRTMFDTQKILVKVKILQKSNLQKFHEHKSQARETWEYIHQRNVYFIFSYNAKFKVGISFYHN
jgi:hypothetical protein